MEFKALDSYSTSKNFLDSTGKNGNGLSESLTQHILFTIHDIFTKVQVYNGKKPFICCEFFRPSYFRAILMHLPYICFKIKVGHNSTKIYTESIRAEAKPLTLNFSTPFLTVCIPSTDKYYRVFERFNGYKCTLLWGGVWANPFGKISIFPLFKLLVFITQKGVFSF